MCCGSSGSSGGPQVAEEQRSTLDNSIHRAHRVRQRPAVSVSETATRGQEWLQQLCHMRWCFIKDAVQSVWWICVWLLLSPAQCLRLRRIHKNKFTSCSNWPKLTSTLSQLWINTSVGHKICAFSWPAERLCYVIRCLMEKNWDLQHQKGAECDVHHYDGVNQPGVMDTQVYINTSCMDTVHVHVCQ